MQRLFRLATVAVLAIGAGATEGRAVEATSSSICSTCTGWSECPTDGFDCASIGCSGMLPGCAVGVPSCRNAFIVCSGGDT